MTQFQLEFVESEELNGFNFADQVLLVEFLLAFSLITFFETCFLCRVNLGVKVKSSKNGTLSLIVSILSDFLQNLKARETQVFYKSFKQLSVWVFSSVFHFKLSKHNLFFKL